MGFFRKLGLSAVALALSITAANASFIANFHPNLDSNRNASLFIFGEDGATGTVSNNAGFSQNFTLDSSGVLFLDLDNSAFMDSSGTINQQSFLVNSADPISGLALNRRPASTDMTVLFDTDSLGTEYYAMGFNGRFGEGGQMSVTAVEDNTVVTITSPVALNGNAANTPFQVTLNAGESIKYNVPGGDVTGTRLVADKDIAVFGGAACTQVPNGLIACDHLISQMVSTDNYDNEFIVVENFGGGTDGDLVRVLAANDGTEVFVDGVSQGTINAGEFIEIDNIGNALITSTDVVTVGQFIRGQGGSRDTGDPAFAIIPSVNQWLDEYVFSTPIDTESFEQNFLNIAIDTDDLASLMLDGIMADTSGFVTFGDYSIGQIAIDVGAGVISAASAFLATISGFSDFDSYFSLIATSFSEGASPPVEPPMNEIPIPAALPLMVGGLAALRFAGRRRKQST